MPQPGQRHLVIAQLRDEIRRIERRPGRRGGVVACGLEAVDAALAGGFPRGALTEVSGGPASGKTAVALALFAALGDEELAAYVDGRGELYPPAAEALGVDLARMLVVRPAATGTARGADAGLPALWAAEALLASGAFAAVAIDAPPLRSMRGADAIGRRLQSAAERGGGIGLWLAGARGGLRVPAACRIEVSAQHGRIVARRATVSGAPAGGGPATTVRRREGGGSGRAA